MNIGHKNTSEQDTFTIAELAKELDITTRTLRFYEDQGLVHPVRQGQTRIYARHDKARVKWILRGKRVGFSLAEIAEMLDLYNLGDGRIKQRTVTLEKCRSRVSALKEQRDDIETTICELEEFIETLENVAQNS